MIQEKDLRIGNWVEWVFPNRNNQPNKYQFCQVESVRDKIVGVLGSAYGYDQIRPIPITPGILKNVGFSKISELYTISIGKEDLDIWLDTMEVKISDKFIGIKCNYVHQLQNIYFSLTNEELSIQL